jgi:hypothetical protein
MRGGVIPQNSEVQITNNVMYFNGGLVSYAYEKTLEIINNLTKNNIQNLVK